MMELNYIVGNIIRLVVVYDWYVRIGFLCFWKCDIWEGGGFEWVNIGFSGFVKVVKNIEESWEGVIG